MDLDAVLTRKPQLALVDELTHADTSGTRHPKRWQDIEELLNAGIDVYTTLNIQHLESFRDVVAQITGVIQRESRWTNPRKLRWSTCRRNCCSDFAKGRSIFPNRRFGPWNIFLKRSPCGNHPAAGRQPG